MSDMEARGSVKHAQIEAVVIRADGRRENLGVIADSRWWWQYSPQRLLARRRTRKANLNR